MAEPLPKVLGRRPDIPAGSLYLEGFPSTVTGNVLDGPPRTIRPTDRGREHTSPLVTFAAFLAANGLKDPTGAVAHFERCRQLRTQAPPAASPAPAVDPDDVGRLAAGDLDLSSVPVDTEDPADAVRERKELRKAATKAADQAHNAARLAVWDAADKVYDLFRPIIDACLKDPKDRDLIALWDSAHGCLDRLRGAGLLPRAEGAKPAEYRYSRPDLVHLWRIDQARSAKVVAAEIHPRVDRGRTVVRIFRTPVQCPDVDLYVIGQHPEFGAGLHTADQVVVNAETYAPDIGTHLTAARAEVAA